MRLIADLETDGLLDTVSKIHCLVTQEVDTGAVRAWHNDPTITPRDGSVDDGLAYLHCADVIAGHNWCGYDDKVIEKLRGRVPPAIDKARRLDTLVGATVVFPEEHLSALDAGRSKIPGHAMPPKLAGRHSLEAWGWRMGVHKAQKPQDYAVFTQAMLDYCIQDVAVTRELFLRLDQRVKNGTLTVRAWNLEQRFKAVLEKQEARGVLFDVPAAERLTAELQKLRAGYAEELQRVFPPETVVSYTPKLKKRREKVVTFNPNSDKQVGRRLKMNGWKPTKFTDGGQPAVGLEILEEIPDTVAGAKELVLFARAHKRLEQLAEGPSAWLKKVKKDGRIHGRVQHNGAVTSRVKHNSPNMSAVPKVGKWMGKECRALFVAAPGHALVGLDAKGLELRMLAHYFAPIDGGAYAQTVAFGDPHDVNRRAFGIPDGPLARDTAKRGIYCLLYGGGDGKLGKTLGMSRDAAKRARAFFNKNTPAFPKLQRAIANEVRRRGSLGMPDGRRVWIRSAHAALNSLLQGSGAIVMKAATVRLHDRLRELGLDARVHQVLFSHDEVQLEVPLELVDLVKLEALACVPWAGERLGIRCPLAVDVHVGKNWAETH